MPPAKETYTRSDQWPSEQQVLDHIREELRYIRKRLDDHIDDEDATLKGIVKELSRVREDQGADRVKVAGIAGFISLLIAGTVTWILNQFKP